MRVCVCVCVCVCVHVCVCVDVRVRACVCQVGNKTDLADKRKVTREEAEDRARKLKVIYVETRWMRGW